MHNEHRTVSQLVQRMQNGETLALISDAGTPAISDPGFLLTRACIQTGVEVECLPGATAFVPALVNSRLPNDRFVFEGFLPQKKGLKTRLEFLAKEPRTMDFYVSHYKLIKTLHQLIHHLGEERPASVSTEITILYEETVRGSLNEVKQHFEKHPPKGEFVLVVGGKTDK